jgi:hypothetical protein
MATTFVEFFGGLSDDSYTSEGSIDHALHLQLGHVGKPIIYVADDGSTTTFNAIIHKERRDKVQTEYGFDEHALRDVAFPSNNTTGREIVLLHAEVRVGAIKYQVHKFHKKADFWKCELKRISVGEIARGNRRGK